MCKLCELFERFLYTCFVSLIKYDLKKHGYVQFENDINEIEKLITALRLMENGVPDEVVMEKTGLSQEEMNNLWESVVFRKKRD